MTSRKLVMRASDLPRVKFAKPSRVIAGAGGGGKGGGAPQAAKESPNTLQSNSMARVIDLLCEGPIVGLVDGAKSIFLNATPLEAADGTSNFSGITWDTRLGTPDQAYMPGFPDVEREISVGIEVKQSLGAIARTIDDPDVNAARVTILVPALTTQDTNTGDLNGGSIHYQILVAPSGGSDQVMVDRTLTGKCTSSYEESFRFDLPGSAPWTLKVQRITADNTAANIQDKFQFSHYTEIIDSKFTYGDSALVGLQANAQLFGGEIPTRSYLIKGRQIKVPANYDPATRAYTGIWDGSFVTAWTDNPAWCLYDLLINTRYGAGIDESFLDKFTFYDIAQYCDELVPDGFGGQEPRYALNILINTQQQAFDLINALCSVFRGMAYWAAGAIVPVADMPRDPDLIATPANVINGDFTYSGSSLSARHTAALITWNDPDNNYQRAIEAVEDPELIQKFGYVTANQLAVGCTSRGMARRVGKWIIDSEKFATETIKYQAGLDHAFAAPGQIVQVLDPNYMGARFGGRVVSVDGTTVVIDHPVDLDAGETFDFNVILPDNTIETKTITSRGNSSTLTLSAALSVAPVAGAVWSISGSNATGRLFGILSVSQPSPGIFEISGLQYDPTKYDRVEEEETLDPINYALYRNNQVAPPTNLSVTESLYKSNTSVYSRASLTWTASPDRRVAMYDVLVRRGNGNWVRMGMVSAPAIDLDNTQPDTYAFQIYAVTASGRSAPLERDNVEILGKTAAPGDVTGLTATRQLEGVVLAWNAVTDLDLVGYQVRRGGSWQDGVIAVDNIIGTSVFVPLPDGQTYHLMVRAVDTLGNVSVHSAAVNVAAKIPDDVTDFVITPQQDHLRFDWAKVDGPDVEYIVRVGAAWESGQEVVRTAALSATILYPGSTTATFWIKARSSLNIFSVNAEFATVAHELFANRNIVLDDDEGAATYPGTRNFMEDGQDTGQLVLKQTTGLNDTYGDYYFNVDLGDTFTARNWMEFTVASYVQNNLTWANATFTWNDVEAQGPWQVGADADNIVVTPVIAINTGVVAADLDYAWSLNDTLTPDTGTPTNDESAAVTYGEARIGKGVLVQDITQLGWQLTVAETFTQVFRIAVSPTTPLADDAVLATLAQSAGSGWLKVGWDGSADSPGFYVEDSDGNRLDLPATFRRTDFITLAITQDATTRALFYSAERQMTHGYASATLAALGSFDRLRMYDAA